VLSGPSATPLFKYQFTSAVEDLLDAEEAERSRSIRKPVRSAIVVLGALWLGTGIVVFATTPDWRAAVWIALGAVVIYKFVVKPHSRRRRIRTGNAASQGVSLEFDNDSLRMEVAGVGSFTRQWDQLTAVADSPKGVLVFFTDGIVNWLPSRVFGGPTERQQFIDFARNRQVQAQAQEKPSGPE
jgi:YcxB-like protein